MSITDDFLSRYDREFDFYQEAARLCAQQCETDLETNGIRAIVTYRAKRTERLKDKVENRNQEKNYQCVEDIYTDLVDLAGVRIALYFPGDMDKVEKIVSEKFEIEEDKKFPPRSSEKIVSEKFEIEEDKKFPPRSSETLKYKKRFTGYAARHYRGYLSINGLAETQKRYAQAQIEIQVASVLMHAWAEVEHDLVYKPLSGELSEDEYAILDELNGLVLAGEIALERLQRAANLRLSLRNIGDRFNNHYELAAYILRKSSTSVSEPVMGRADVLFRFLQRIGKDRPQDIEPYLEELEPEIEDGPIADRIIDRIIAGEPELDEQYLPGLRDIFITKSSNLNRAIKILAQLFRLKSNMFMPMGYIVRQLTWIPKETQREIDYISKLRNNVVRGLESPDETQLLEASKSIDRVLTDIQNNIPDNLREAFQQQFV